MNNFDYLASSYNDSIKLLPSSFVDLIVDTFKLRTNDKIIDIGCGAGTVTIPLSKKVENIVGIDMSEKMIRLAQSNDSEKKINWILGDACSMKFDYKEYRLAFFYEAFHLISGAQVLLSKLEKSLVKGGFICAGYCIYNWEHLLNKDIIKIFEDNNICINDWFIQKPNKFEYLINNTTGMSKVRERFIKVKDYWNAEQIARFVTSISIFLSLSPAKIALIKDQIKIMIIKKYGDNLEGYSYYYIRYSQKI